MHTIALFCKSYRPDLQRCATLVESLRRHNRAGLPVYLSVPAADRPLFRDRIGDHDVAYLDDEEVMGGPVAQSWVTQQLVKLCFARLGACANYFWIDSDCVVIRDFDERELLARPDLPFTVIGEARRDLCRDRLLGGLDPARDPEYARMFEGLLASLAVVRDAFQRRGPAYFFGAPAIWSCRVVHALEDWLRERTLSFSSMLARSPYEMAWYGEFLLAHPVIPIVPRSDLAFHFARDAEYQRFVAAGLTVADLAAHGYLAVTFASKWMQAIPVAAEPARAATTATATAEPARGLDLTTRWRGSYHRVGWGYALDALLPLHHPDGILVEGFVEKKFAWGRDPGDWRNDFRPITRPWIGFWHNPPAIPSWFNADEQAPDDILASAGWCESLAACRGIFTLSEAVARWLRSRVPVPVCSLKHPSATPRTLFSVDSYRRNPSRSIAQIGYWLRRLGSLYELPVRHLHKVLLDARQPWMNAAIERELALVPPERRSGVVTPLSYLEADAYDEFLSRNLVFLHLHDASASNTIVECILRRTPLLVNPLEAVVEYLGADYPLYFETLEEAAAKAEDQQAVQAAHVHLAQIAARCDLTQEAFYRSFLDSPISRALGLSAPA